MAVVQSPGKVPLFIVIYSSRARYGFMASPSILSISPGIRSGPTDLFSLLLIVLISMLNGLVVLSSCISGILSSVLNTVEK